MTIPAEQARFERYAQHGPAVAVAAGELLLCSVTLLAGQFGLFRLVQSVRTNPSSTVLDRQVAGLTWRAYVSPGRAVDQRRPLALEPTPAIGWTYTDGRPITENLLVLPGSTLYWYAVVDAATLPATVTHVAGGIEGWLIRSGGFTEDQLLALVQR